MMPLRSPGLKVQGPSMAVATPDGMKIPVCLKNGAEAPINGFFIEEEH